MPLIQDLLWEHRPHHLTGKRGGQSLQTRSLEPELGNEAHCSSNADRAGSGHGSPISKGSKVQTCTRMQCLGTDGPLPPSPALESGLEEQLLQKTFIQEIPSKFTCSHYSPPKIQPLQVTKIVTALKTPAKALRAGAGTRLSALLSELGGAASF